MLQRHLTVCLLAIALLTVAVPVASASTPACQDASDAGAQGHYLRSTDDGDVEVWEETNGIDGLQTESCMDVNGRTWEPDTRTATVPPTLPGLPDPGPLCVAVPGPSGPPIYLCLT